jgi:peptide/nickel transport system permease protein
MKNANLSISDSEAIGENAELLRMMQRRSSFSVFIHRLLKNKPGTVGVVLILLICFTAIFADVLAPQSPTFITLPDRLKPPAFIAGGSPKYLLGTDSIGRDILSRIIHGSRISLMVGLAAIIVGAGIGIILGLFAGFFGKRTDSIISWLMNVQLSFPFILLAIFMMALFKGGLPSLILVLGIGAWVRFARIMRGQVFSVKEETYVTSAIAIGLSLRRVIFRHILPNAIAPIIVVASFTMADTILSEAGLSFLGLGISPEIPSWGQMLADGRDYIQDAWWISVSPGLAISITVLGINLFGDWLRDYFDPRLRV